MIPWGGPVKGGPHGVTRYLSQKIIAFCRDGYKKVLWQRVL